MEKLNFEMPLIEVVEIDNDYILTGSGGSGSFNNDPHDGDYPGIDL